MFDAGSGEYRDGAIRYMMIRPDALMGLFERLPVEARLPALQALGRSIEEFGGRSIAAYREAGSVDGAAMLRTIAATAPQLGWGVWRFRREEATVLLEVQNSPFVAGSGASPHAVCHAIVGMLTALGPTILEGAALVEETRCAAEHGGEVCAFRIAARDEVGCGGTKN